MAYVLQLHFDCTNNMAEYEALLHGLRMAKEMNIKRIRCFGDSDLVAQQVSRTWDSKDANMAAYRRADDQIAWFFSGYQVEHINRRKNEAADALSRLGSRRVKVPPNVFLDELHHPSVKLPSERSSLFRTRSRRWSQQHTQFRLGWSRILRISYVVNFQKMKSRKGNSSDDASLDRKSTRLNSSHSGESRMPSSA